MSVKSEVDRTREHYEERLKLLLNGKQHVQVGLNEAASANQEAVEKSGDGKLDEVLDVFFKNIGIPKSP